MYVMEDLLSVQETADILHLDRSRIGKLCRQGRFHNARKIGERWVIPRESVANFRRLTPGVKPKISNINPDDEAILAEAIKEAEKWKEVDNNE